MNKTEKKVALCFGVTGQDGSYLSELLLEKGYVVHGIIRRASSFNTGRIEHLMNNPNFHLHYGDLTDSSNIVRIIKETEPTEIYNLGAQSHVAVSFESAEYTADVDALGTLRILEAIRLLGREKITRFYQASTSELFGEVQEIPQKETTPFYPKSPYGVAKMYAYWITINYRESYGMYACNGILFNHETVSANMPMFVKIGDNIDIRPMYDILTMVNYDDKQYQQFDISNIDICVWGIDGWVKATTASAYPHDTKGDNKCPVFINSRNFSCHTTSDHVIFTDRGEVSAKDVVVGDTIPKIEFPIYNSDVDDTEYSLLEAEMLGMLVADGYFNISGEGVKFCKNDENIRNRMKYLWSYVVGGSIYDGIGKSGFPPYNSVSYLGLNGGREYLMSIDMYTSNREKRIPIKILNSSKNIQLAFLRGYNNCDGLKQNKCTYEFKSFKTNSATLAQGLYYLSTILLEQDMDITIEQSSVDDSKLYYSINLLSPKRIDRDKIWRLHNSGISQRGIARELGISNRNTIRKVLNNKPTGNIFRKCHNEVKKIIDMSIYDGWYCDLETSSGEFFAGVGTGHVHNSPRRGETFVTRKITRTLGRIAVGSEECLYLGNLNALRDWGHAKDYVEMQWRMLQQPFPEDFVIATGKQSSVRDFVQLSAKELGIELIFTGEGINEIGVVSANSKEFCEHLEVGDVIVRVNPRYFRPAEVETLLGDPAKAKEKLGWEPTTSLQELCSEMMLHDYKLAKQEKNNV